jgi:hypothetical protein
MAKCAVVKQNGTLVAGPFEYGSPAYKTAVEKMKESAAKEKKSLFKLINVRP